MFFCGLADIRKIRNVDKGKIHTTYRLTGTASLWYRDSTAYKTPTNKIMYPLIHREASRFLGFRDNSGNDAGFAHGCKEEHDLQQCPERNKSIGVGVHNGSRLVLRGHQQLDATRWVPTLWLERGECAIRPIQINKIRKRGICIYVFLTGNSFI